jgi:hypothetical protein
MQLGWVFFGAEKTINTRQPFYWNAIHFNTPNLWILAGLVLLTFPVGAQELNANWFLQMHCRTLGPPNKGGLGLSAVDIVTSDD